MASAETNSVQNHMNNLRIKMVQQKIQNEKDRLRNRSASPDSTDNDFENQARLQQAMLKRQELLDKIRREQMMNDEGNRPRTYSARRRYTPSPLLVPPSRRSLPGFNHYNNFYNQYPETQRSKPGNSSPVRHVIEHKIPEPKAPQFLPPINQQQRVLQQPPPVIIQPQPQPHIMQQPGAHIIQGPPQQIIQVPGNPVVQNLGPSQPDNRGMFNKADFMEMMMLQNAQMHHIVMQHMMVNSLPGSKPQQHTHPIVADSPVVVPRGSPAGVHHHHYTAPPSQPPIHHYSTVPSFDMRGNYPLQGYTSGYTAPGNSYNYYDDGNNYYTYH